MNASDEQTFLQLSRQTARDIFALSGTLATVYLASRIAGGSQVNNSHKPSEKPPDEQTFLQAMYKEYCDRLRQNETSRQQSTTLVFALSGTLAAIEGALLAFAAKPLAEIGLTWSGAPLFLILFTLIGIFIVALGVLGRSLNIKHSERAEVHDHYSRAYRRELDKMFGAKKYRALRDDALKEFNKEWPYQKITPGTKTYVYWININYLLIALGGIMALIPLIVLLFRGFVN